MPYFLAATFVTALISRVSRRVGTVKIDFTVSVYNTSRNGRGVTTTGVVCITRRPLCYARRREQTRVKPHVSALRFRTNKPRGRGRDRGGFGGGSWTEYSMTVAITTITMATTTTTTNTTIITTTPLRVGWLGQLRGGDGNGSDSSSAARGDFCIATRFLPFSTLNRSHSPFSPTANKRENPYVRYSIYNIDTSLQIWRCTPRARINDCSKTLTNPTQQRAHNTIKLTGTFI